MITDTKSKPVGSWKGGIWHPDKAIKRKLNVKQEIKDLGIKKRILSKELRQVSQELAGKIRDYFGWEK